MPVRRTLSGRFITATVVGASVASIGLVTLVAQPAQAFSSAFIRPTSWAYTDSTAPNSTFTGTTVDARVGSWTDSTGTVHTSRSYFTWDLSAYVGATPEPTELVAVEKSVNDCATERRIHFVETSTPSGPITWNNPPAAQRKASTVSPPDAPCPSPHLEYVVTDAVRRALRGTGILTLEVRVPGNAENNVAFGRSIANSLGLALKYNHAPNPPTDLRVDDMACGPDPLYVRSLRPTLQATLTDPNVNATGGGQDWLSGIFQIWPVGHPELVTEVAGGGGYTVVRATTTVPEGVLVDGGKYAYKVRANDSQVDSKPSEACRFNVDVTRPTKAPTVTSTDYPAGTEGHGGAGLPGTFTLSAGGDKDIVTFRYGQAGSTYVAADRPGGTATVTITPTRSGPYEFSVVGMDKANNAGPSTTYRFWVTYNAPQVVITNPDADPGQPRTFTFAPGMDGVVSYVYRFNNGAETTVAAAGGDRTASVTFPASTFKLGVNDLRVRSVTATGYRSEEASSGFYLPATPPSISSNDWPLEGDFGPPAGTTGTFTFTSVIANVTSYSWYIDGSPQEPVTAAADGTATVSYTPTESGFHEIVVVGHTANGDTDQAWSYFLVS